MQKADSPSPQHTPFRWVVQTIVGLQAAGLATVIACSGAQPTADDVRREAACAAARTFYGEAQTELINSGACDQVDDVKDCLPHVALKKTRTRVLVELQCTTDPGAGE